MDLIERLEQAAKKYDRRARNSACDGHYDFGAAELRELLEEAARALRGPPVFNVPAGFDLGGVDLRPVGYIEARSCRT